MRKVLFIDILILGFLIIFGGCEKKDNVTETSREYIHVGKNWAKLASMKGNPEYKIVVKSKSNKYKIGDQMSFDVYSNRDGYLYVLYTDQKDNTTLAFPNEKSTKNEIIKDKKFTIPDSDSWEIKAVAPKGKSLLTFLVFKSEDDAQDFFQKDYEIDIDNNKNMKTSKDIAFTKKKDYFGVGNVVIEVE